MPADYGDEEVKGIGGGPSAMCLALLRQLTGLRSLRLMDANDEVSSTALHQLSCLSPCALTSLELRCATDNKVGGGVGAGDWSMVAAATYVRKLGIVRCEATREDATWCAAPANRSTVFFSGL